MTTKEFKIKGMSCMKVEIGNARITYDETKYNETDFVKAIEEAGYKVIQ